MARESNELTPQSHFASETRSGLSYQNMPDITVLIRKNLNAMYVRKEVMPNDSHNQ